jgi:hypothetical protein
MSSDIEFRVEGPRPPSPPRSPAESMAQETVPRRSSRERRLARRINPPP